MNKMNIVSYDSIDPLGTDDVGSCHLTNRAELFVKMKETADSTAGLFRILGTAGITNDYGRVSIGALEVQFGKLTNPAGVANYHVNFPVAFANNNVFVFIQEADNGSPNQAQLDGQKLPNSTGFDVIVNTQQDGAVYFWMAIGQKK